MDQSPDQSPENEAPDSDRRAFLKEGMKKAALLPYVAPVIESISLSDAYASDDDDDGGGSDDDDDNGGGRGNRNSGPPSVIGNGPPPVPRPRIRSVSPKEGYLGDELSITIRGDNFRPGARVEFGSGITVRSVRFDNSRQLTVLIKISEYTSPGWRDVTVINPDRQSDTDDRAFTVKRPPRPEISSVSPKEKYQGEQVTVTVKGKNFREHFNITFGSGILVSDERFANSKTITARLNILSSASPGYRDVTIVNSDRQEDTKYNAFKVKEKKKKGGGNDDDDDRGGGNDDDDDD